MDILHIIDKKRTKQELTKEEIEYFITNYTTTGIVKDYQASALLMAICINGMTEQEVFYLCDAMLHSGDIVDLSYVNGITFDKHSSGGVSDTTSIALIPILACANLASVKMSGAGLGFTGGTIDKLCSFEGIKLQQSKESIKNIVNKCKCVIISQTDNLTPADKKLYALRDITSTVQSMPLMATSIMSKKIAANNDIIFLDVKTGESAFMEKLEDAKQLASLMLKIGTYYNKKVATVITDMNEPLGNGIGCYLEILDTIDVLQGKQNRLSTLIKFMAVKIMVISNLYDESSANAMYDDIIASGKGLKKLEEMVTLLGGDFNTIKQMRDLKPTSIIKADNDGYFAEILAKEFGYLVCDMGGGRKELTDVINHSVGVKVMKHIGDKVKKGEVLFEIYNTNNKLSDKEIQDRIKQNYKLSPNHVEPTLLIKEYNFN